MNKLRVVEVYASFQGEGPNTSKPTVFVRFAGCNFKCPGWPCDTQHAIDPKLFTKTQTFEDPFELATAVASFNIKNVCLTGGEVFLQNEEALEAFVGSLSDGGHNIECFTNGGLEWPDDIALKIDNFILDWKLPGSDETYTGDALSRNLDQLGDLDAVKFTIKDHADFLEALGRYKQSELFGLNGPKVYAGVVWGAMKTEELAKWILDEGLPWNLNVQVHKFIWHPDKIGV